MDFKTVEQKYKELRSQFEAGQLTEQAYKDRLKELMVQDEQGRWWSIGYETGRWSYHDGTGWVVDEGRPPVYPEEPARLAPRFPVWAIAVGIILVMVIGFLTIRYVFHFPPAATQTPAVPSVTIPAVTATEKVFSASPTPLTPTSTLPSSWNQGQIIFLQLKDNHYHDLYLLDLQAGSLPKILLQQVSNQSFYAPWFSRDGSKFVFEDMNNKDIIYDLKTKTGTTFDRCGSPTFSPDGSEIVCGSKDTFLFYNSAGILERSFIENNALEPAWSPIDEMVVFAVKNGDGASIWRMDTSGNQLVQLTHEAGDNSGPAWSPDGKWIAYQAGQPGSTDIWIMDRDGGGKRQITQTTAGWSFGPAWSPDGKWLAYVSGKSNSDYGEIFVISVATGEFHQVTHTGGNIYDWRVTWGPK